MLQLATSHAEAANHADILDESLEATCVPFVESNRFEQLDVWYEAGRKAVWMMMKPSPRPSFNSTILREIMGVDHAIRTTKLPVEFHIVGSARKGMFNVGGDLDFFVECIRSGDRQALRDYAHLCIDAIYSVYAGHGRDIVTLALVEGTALGGGFESALANHFVLAQDDAKMGFPEIAFNLFPGMGAYSFAARRSSQAVAEELIFSGEARAASWHRERGLADRLFGPGEGLRAARTFMDTVRPKLNGTRAMLRARHRINPVSHEELIDVTNDWVDAAFQLEPKDVAYMERLVQLQSRRR